MNVVINGLRLSPWSDLVAAVCGTWSQARRWGKGACGSLEGWTWCAHFRAADQAQTLTLASAVRCSTWTSRPQMHGTASGGRVTGPEVYREILEILDCTYAVQNEVKHTCRITVFRSDGGCSPRIRATSSSFWALWSLESVWAVNEPSSSWTPKTARASPALAIYLHMQRKTQLSYWKMLTEIWVMRVNSFCVQVWSVNVGHTCRCSGKGHPQDPVVQERIGVSNLQSDITLWASRRDTRFKLQKRRHLSSVWIHKSLNLDADIFLHCCHKLIRNM